ncbi:Alpha crystallin/Hsp20 domain [Macleaya cordata]|uniref:Alpha crystallin/Hsp20 domain n=1 Tax=Macleaya cordata TaxID=56857 RepID=A0A200QBF8_MACCD|nr:Alpha crystallin/Hsp20 domain [Macleaya cordata]
MALLSRLALKKLAAASSTPSVSHVNYWSTNRALHQGISWSSSDLIVRRFTTTAAPSSSSSSSSSSEDKSDGGDEVTVSSDHGGDRKKSSSKWLPRKLRKKGGGLWRSNNNPASGALVPFNLNHLFSSGLGDALLQASENLNKLFENLAPSKLIGRMKENESNYKLRFEVPGLAKEDVKITIEGKFLTIKGEHKEEEEEDSEDDELWSSASSYGYYETSLLLPDDAKVEEIKAEMKDGILYITIPRTETTKKKDVKEIPIN